MVTKLAPPKLSGKQSRHLRALAHHLEPVVHLGKEGASEAVIEAVSQALADHELIKVRLPQIEKTERHELANVLAAGTPAHLVAELGRIAVLYRRHPSKPKIVLPRE
jgi:RNA-binding protein